MHLIDQKKKCHINVSDPRVAAFGEWNTTNLGDQAILEGVVTFFQTAGWKVDAYSLGSLTPTLKLPKQPSIEISPDISATVPQPRSIFQGLKEGGTRLIKRTLRPFRKQIHIRKLIPHLQTAEVILVGGGSLLSDRDLHFPQSLREISWAAKTLKIPLICLGCGSVESWTARGQAMIGDFANACTLIAAREPNTAERLTQVLGHPVPIFGDFAFTCPEKLTQHQAIFNSSHDWNIGLNVMHLKESNPWESYQLDYETALVISIETWVARNCSGNPASISVFTTGATEDIEAAKRVYSRLGTLAQTLEIPTSVTHLRQIIAAKEVVITSRLHAAILALDVGVPVIGFAAGNTHKKLNDFFQSLNIRDYNIGLKSLEETYHHFLNIFTKSYLEQQFKDLNVINMVESRKQVNDLLGQLAAKSRRK